MSSLPCSRTSATTSAPFTSGLPLVTSNTSGPRDYMENGKTGYMFDPYDAKGFADGIKKLKEVYQVNMNENGTFTYDIRRIHMEGKTVFDHTMAVLKFAKKGYVNGLAAIYHDVGKNNPEYKNGKVRFIHHEYIGSKIVNKLFQNLCKCIRWFECRNFVLWNND